MKTRQKMAYEAPTIKRSQVILDGTILAASVMTESKDQILLFDDKALDAGSVDLG